MTTDLPGTITQPAVLQTEPLVTECPLEALDTARTPNALFFIRNHYAAPHLDRASWRLAVEGAVMRPLSLSFEHVVQLPATTLAVTLECAGNGRSFIQPPTPGNQFSYGAASTAEWRGVRLADVLDMAGLQPSVVEVLLEGADRGRATDEGGPIAFTRSVPLQKALHLDTLLAYEMNGRPLPVEHGFPLRAIIPGWYGMASVKWLVRLVALEQPFTGFHQATKYVVDRGGAAPKEPLRHMRVRSLMVAPTDGARVPQGAIRIAGMAWSGEADIAQVEVSTDGGATWQPVALGRQPSPYAWCRWECTWQPQQRGPATLMSRATDARGQCQPARPEWNALGYGNNAIQAVRVEIV